MGRGVLRRVGWPQGSAGEFGSMAPLAVAAAFVLFAILAFSVDQGIAYATKARQENALDAARAACMDASFALEAKNDDDPAMRFVDRAVRAVRDAGCSGSVAMWFYEAPEEDVPEAERVWVVGLQVSEDSPTVFARGFGVEGIPVASHRVMAAVPYAESRVWRPEQRTCGRFDVAAGLGATSAAFTELRSLDEFPAEVGEQVRAVLSAQEGKERRGGRS
ncbi:hypothetical protein B5F40_01960 [Gordonibacter sp. An230]|uniref:hypothetical protein n=1 Tax=Gordonibacter sp. An230 TaxID=1965592 RepID=UPI000B3AD01A|nr:hypothetical protein [Gordonibacter sp. An230]OUO92119.1 hypothetical protein B5F40_01960 [Gordonibacter sp. An230]